MILDFVKCNFCVYLDNSMVSSFVEIIYYKNWLSDVKLTLHP